jgi:hypothetical protein
MRALADRSYMVPHTRVPALRFEGVGTRAGPRPSGRHGKTDLTIPRLYDAQWSGPCIHFTGAWTRPGAPGMRRRVGV